MKKIYQTTVTAIHEDLFGDAHTDVMDIKDEIILSENEGTAAFVHEALRKKYSDKNVYNVINTNHSLSFCSDDSMKIVSIIDVDAETFKTQYIIETIEKPLF